MPLPDAFRDHLKSLEESYLAENDPIRQSGFGGGAERWRSEREPILDAIDSDGSFLDVGCANGYLLESLIRWGLDRNVQLVPFGLDQGSDLIALARTRLPQHAANFYVGNAWDWESPRRFDYVYALHDCVPVERLPELVEHLLRKAVAPKGRLILGSYGSRSRGVAPFDGSAFLRGLGHEPVGTASGGSPPVAAFAWIDRLGSVQRDA